MCQPVVATALALSGESRGTWVVGRPGLRGSNVSEESFPLSEMLVGENAVVRVGKGAPGDEVLDSTVFGPAI